MSEFKSSPKPVSGQKLNHWSNYWQGGNLTSLPQDFRENYDGTIGAFWTDVFSGLTDSANLLDLCTGNGAIALLASRYAVENHRQFKITAVDASKIDKKNILQKYPNQANLLESVNFISECAVEDISLASAQFDLITSQYGIEYCDWAQAASQVARLLKPGGCFAFISHASSTAILTYMEQEEHEYQQLHQAGLFTTLASFITGKSKPKDTLRKLVKLNKLTHKASQKSGSALLASISQVLQQLANMEKTTLLANKDKVKYFYLQHTYANRRMQDVLKVTQQIQATPDWYQVFEKAGLALVEEKEIMQAGNHNAGHAFKFVKPA